MKRLKLKRIKRQLLWRPPIDFAKVKPENATLVKWAKERGYECRGRNSYILTVWRLHSTGKAWLGNYRSAATAKAAIEKDIKGREGNL